MIKLKDTPILQSIQKVTKENSLLKLPPIIFLILFRSLCSNLLYFFIKNRKNVKPIVGFSNIYYNGNPRAVFESMLKNNDDYEIFWYAFNLKSLKDVRKAGGKVFYKKGILGIPYFLKADLWVIAHIGRDIPQLPHKNYKVIQLWHAVGTKGIDHTKETFDNYDAWCVSSEFSKNKYVELWDAPPEKIFVTGFAEMDLLFKHLNAEKDILLDELCIEKGKKIIFYAPTYDLGLWPWNNSYEEFEKLCIFCKERNLILILRLHPYSKINKKLLENIIKKYDNVYWRDMSAEPDVMNLLSIADILITDWSSLYMYYYLTNRPIVFLDVESDHFTKKRGGVEIPPEFRAGEKASSSEEFYKLLNKVLKTGNSFKDDQEKYLKIIFGEIDGKASENVVKLIDQKIIGPVA